MKRLFSTKTSDSAFSFATLILRLGAGLLILINFGLNKLMHFSTIAPRFSDPFHIGTTASLSMVIFAEFFCAVFIVLGLFTRLAAIPLIIAMAVAIFTAHGGHFFGKESLAASMFLIAFIAILFFGPGKISLDRFIAG
jgi:putative oxidoreductase